MKILVLTTLLLTAATSFAAQKKQASTEATARATASFFNRMSSVEEYLAVIERNVSQEQMEKFRKRLSLNGVDTKAKFPHMKYDGNKVYFDKENYLIFVDENTVNVNGYQIRKGVKGIDVVYKEVMERLNTKKTSMFSILPEAHALSNLGGIMGMVATGALGYFVGPSLGVSAMGGAVLFAGGFFLLNEAYQYLADGNISCGNKGEYLVRKKVRNGLFASGEHEVLDQASLQEVFRDRPVPPCNAATLKMYKNGIANYEAAPRPVGYPPYAQQTQTQDVPQVSEGVIQK